MAEHSNFIEVNGHQVPAEMVDMFLSGKTGEPISDTEWDEQKRRLEQDNDHLVPEEFRGV